MKSFIAITLVTLTLGAFVLHNMYSTEEPSYTDRLDEIINTVNKSNTTWKAGRNPRWENSNLELVKKSFMKSEFYGVKKAPASSRIFHSYQSVKSAPESFDSRTQWPNCSSLNEIRDQSSCGSCWAFAAAESMSDRICIHSNGQKQTRVSAEDLMECCSDCGDGCNGGFPFATFQYWKESGIVSGGLYGDKNTCKPYKFAPCAHHVAAGKYPACPSGEYDTPSCSNSCVNGSEYFTDKSFGKSAYTVSGEADLKAEVSTNGPVEVAFTVYEDFPTYKTGVYQHVTGGALGGHAVKLMGYGTENGTPYWLIANSWNETWGDNGYFKILRGSDECGVEDEGATGLPA